MPATSRYQFGIVLIIASVFSGCLPNPPQPDMGSNRSAPTEPAVPLVHQNDAAETVEQASQPTANAAEVPAPFEAKTQEPELRELREWHDVTGKFSTTARYDSVTDGRVALLREDGSSIKVPFEKLAEADQEYVRRVSGQPLPNKLAGKVVAVLGGDQIVVKGPDGKNETVFVNGYSRSSPKADLIKRVFNRTVDVQWQRRDAQGHIRGDVFVDNYKIVDFSNYDTPSGAEATSAVTARRNSSGEPSIPSKDYLLSGESSGGKVWVRPYTRKDGTQVRGHWRSR